MDQPLDLALDAEQRSAAAAEPAVRASPNGVARGGLFRKYLLLFIGLVSTALLVNAAVDLAFTYRDSRALLAQLQLEKVDIAKERIEQFIGDIRRQLEWTTTAQFAALAPDQRHFQLLLLLRQVPAITEVSQLDEEGREQVKVSRIALDAVGSQADFSGNPVFTEARAHKVWFSLVHFRMGSEPYLTLAIAGAGRRPGVTVAEVNLKLIWDVVTAMRIGQAGYAYVVDRQGRLIAHPDMSLVLRDTSFSNLPQVAEGLRELQAPDDAAAIPLIEPSFNGRRVLSAHAALPALGWLVFVELPMSEALAPLFASALHTLLVLIGGLALAALAAWFVVRRMMGPVRLLQAGAARIGAGDLDARIEVRTGDELETLANQFNSMAGRLKQSYASLERKVEELTAELAVRNTAFAEQVEHQAATIDVLKVMSASTNDTQPVFDIILRRAMQLCDSLFGQLHEFDGELVHFRAHAGWQAEAVSAYQADFPMVPTRELITCRAILDRQTIHFRDLGDVAGLSKAVRRLGHKSALVVPLMREGSPIGAISVGHKDVGGFTDAQVELLKTFAEQAVIAIGSVATFRELQQRTAELTRSVAELQALEEVLRAVNSSLDLETVLATIIERAVPLAQADEGMIYEFDGAQQVFMPKAAYGMTGERIARLRERRIRIGETYLGRSAVERLPVHIADVQQDQSAPEVKELLQGIHAVLAVPLLREDKVIGGLVIRRRSEGAFEEATVKLLQTFAAQSVLAIANARLYDEIQARTKELTDLLEIQSATAEVLKAISRSAFDLDAVLDTLTRSAANLCSAATGIIYIRQDEHFRVGAMFGHPSSMVEFRQAKPVRAGRHSASARVALSHAVEHILDAQNDPEFDPDLKTITNNRTVVGVPLLRGDKLEGVFVLGRTRVEAFSQRQIELVQTFADQALIAIENARLFNEVQARTRELSQSLEDLRTAQDRLIQTEKLASLGQLTAGIAHEIKNPLNFVNNFSALSVDLIDELRTAIAPAPLDAAARAEVDEVTELLRGNLEKVVQHGKRADGIVKNMLLHARETGGERRQVDFNATVEEALNLAYHGARAEKPGFNVTLERNYDPAVGSLDLYPQEFTRVLLNLIGNGFYAVNRRQREDQDPAYVPTVAVATKRQSDAVLVRVRDNGTGIPDAVKARLFEPFFTTKPAGEGTGLGLSISHDIVVKQHGGSIAVESRVGEYTEFSITVPRTSAGASA